MEARFVPDHMKNSRSFQDFVEGLSKVELTQKSWNHAEAIGQNRFYVTA